MLNKEQRKQIKEVQLAAAKLQEALADVVAGIQDDVVGALNDKTETMQEKFKERHPWLEDFICYDLGNLESELEVFAGLEVE